MVVTVTSYEVLAARMVAFAKSSRARILVISGEPGLGKTELAKAHLPDDGGKTVLHLGGYVTDRQLWEFCQKNADAIIVIDDLTSIFKDANKAMILMQLCGSGDVRIVRWHVYRPRPKPKDDKDKVDLDQSFEFRGKVLILCNAFKKVNENLGAVEDRGVHVEFVPTAAEVHAEVDRWRNEATFEVEGKKVPIVDPEVYEYIGSKVPEIVRPSFRHYMTASDDLRDGLDWKETLHDVWNDLDADDYLLLLLKDTSLSKGDRRRLWMARFGMQKSQYYDRLKRVNNRLDEQKTAEERAEKLQPHKAIVTVEKHSYKKVPEESPKRSSEDLQSPRPMPQPAIGTDQAASNPQPSTQSDQENVDVIP